MATSYYTLGMLEPPTLLRNDGEGTHEAFVNGQWQCTTAIMRWMVGNNDFVDHITEAEARAIAPAAFTRDEQVCQSAGMVDQIEREWFVVLDSPGDRALLVAGEPTELDSMSGGLRHRVPAGPVRRIEPGQRLRPWQDLWFYSNPVFVRTARS